LDSVEMAIADGQRSMSSFARACVVRRTAWKASRLELRHFRYFLALATHLNFTRAAKTVHVTQSTLSHQIRQLEDQVGFRLFNRTGRSVTLTEAGEALVPGVTRGLRELDEAVRGLKHVAAGPTGEVNIVLGTRSFGAGLLPACLELFASRHSNIVVSVEEVASSALMRAMEGGAFDLGIGDKPAAETDFRFEPLYQEEMWLAVSQGHPLANRRRLRLTELHGQKIAVPGKDVPVRKTLDECFRSVGAEPHIVAEINQPERLVVLAQQSDIAVIVTRNLSRDRDGLATIVLEDPTPTRTLGILWRPGSDEQLASRLFAEVVREVLRLRGVRTPDWLAIDPWTPGTPSSDRAQGAAQPPQLARVGNGEPDR
jgi:LysR family transcriptional regulator, cyn operon transcriptional activator